MSDEKYNWQNPVTLPSHAYTCGYCGNPLVSQLGYFAKDSRGPRNGSIYICHYCSQPTFIDNLMICTPGVPFGKDVSGIDNQGVSALYSEARQAAGVNSYTAAVMCCRTLLMHIAVEKGADENESFAHYVDYLAANHFVPPDAICWVDDIRKSGNAANHEIVIVRKEEAEELLSFSEMLLRIIYEFPAAVRERHGEASSKEG